MTGERTSPLRHLVVDSCGFPCRMCVSHDIGVWRKRLLQQALGARQAGPGGGSCQTPSVFFEPPRVHCAAHLIASLQFAARRIALLHITLFYITLHYVTLRYITSTHKHYVARFQNQCKCGLLAAARAHVSYRIWSLAEVPAAAGAGRQAGRGRRGPLPHGCCIFGQHRA